LVDEVVMPMESLADTNLILGGDVSLDHVFSHPIQLVVEQVVTPMQSSVDPTLLLESDQSYEVVEPTQSSTDPTLISGSDTSFDHVLNISNLIPSKQGGILLSLSTLPPVEQLRGGGGVNQLLLCLNNYASFKIFTRHSMMITIMQGNKQWHIQHQSHI
jgi:hypothetical protein